MKRLRDDEPKFRTILDRWVKREHELAFRKGEREGYYQCIVRERVPYEENGYFVGTQQEIAELFYYPG